MHSKNSAHHSYTSAHSQAMARILDSGQTSRPSRKLADSSIIGAHSGHKLNLCHREYYDSATVTFVSDYGIDCDMYEGCGAMLLDNISNRQEALAIMVAISNG